MVDRTLSVNVREDATVLPYHDLETAYEQLITGNIDAVACTPYQAAEFLQFYAGGGQYSVHELTNLPKFEFAAIVAKGNSALLTAANRIIRNSQAKPGDNSENNNTDDWDF